MKYTNLILQTVLMTSVCGGSVLASSSVDLDADNSAVAPSAGSALIVRSAGSAFSASDSTKGLSDSEVTVSASVIGTGVVPRRITPQCWDSHTKSFQAVQAGAAALYHTTEIDFHSIATSEIIGDMRAVVNLSLFVSTLKPLPVVAFPPFGGTSSIVRMVPFKP